MVLLFEWWNFEFWKGIKDGLESIMYLYQAIFTFTNFLIAFVSLFISFKLYTVSIATLKQIEDQNKEIQEQRLSSYRPDLVIEEKNFNFKFEKLNNSIINYPVKHTDHYFNDSSIDFNENDPFQLNIINIGLGPARDIKIEIAYNINQMISSIPVFFDTLPNIYKFTQYPTEKITTFLNETSGKAFQISILQSYVDEFNATHLINYSNNGDKMTIPVMMRFKLLYQLVNYYLSVWYNLNPKENIAHPVGELRVRLFYKDVSDVQLCKYYVVRYFPHSFFSDSSINFIRLFRTNENFEELSTSPTNLSQKA